VPRRNNARTQRRGRGLSLAGIATLGLATIAAPAHAALTAVSPNMDGLGLPQWYDEGQQKLTICPTGTPNCGPFVDFAGPGGEAFYNRAVAKITAPNNAKLTMVLATEAAFDPVFTNTPITFTRIRSKIVGGAANTTYNVIEPFGSQSITTDGVGTGTATDQVGCVISAAAPSCDWSVALGGGISGWLRWDPNVLPAAPAGFLGDAANDHAITGSPLGQNYFEVSGPGMPTQHTDLFTVTGKMFDPNVAAFGSTPAAFGGQRLGTTSAVRQVVLRNDGGAAMTVSGVAVGGANAGDFAIVKNGCATVAPNGGTCKVDVTLSPTATGARTATLSVADDAPGGPHTVGLSGTGTQSVLAASPGGVGYGSQTVGTTTPPRSVSVDNDGSAPLNVGAMTIAGASAGDYALGVNTCAAAVAPGASCHVEVLFTPSAAGVRNATLSVAGDGGKADVSLSGTGVARPGAAGGSQPAATPATAAATPAHASASPPPLSITSLGMAARMKQSKARKLGFRLTMRVPDGTVVVRIRVYRKTGKRLTLLSDGYRTPAAAGLFRVQQSHAQLRRQLKRGAYEVQVTPGYSTRELGVTSKISFKVV
jgi:hypothetical protein